MEENKNIFEGAKFGEKFVTREGKIAIYHYYNGTIMNQHNLILKDGGGICCKPDGHEIGYLESDDDIISKYHEEIDEEKLDKMARKEYEDPLTWPQEYYGGEFAHKFVECFKSGYRKAKEE